MFRRALVIAIIAIVFSTVTPLYAGGLRTTFGEVVMENVKIGESYSTTRMVNMPLKVMNTSNMELKLLMEILKPREEELKEGYEIIPSTDWIKLDKYGYFVKPSEEAISDVVITIPNDEQYMGKKFQAYIWSHTVGGEGFVLAVGLKSRLLIHISSSKEKEDIVKEAGKIYFEVDPYDIFIKKVKPGRIYNTRKKAKVSLNITNPNDRVSIYRIDTLRVKDSFIELARGYEDTPNSAFLTFSKTQFSIDRDGKEQVNMYLAFPDEEEYRNKKYMFIIRTTLLNAQIPVTMYSRVFVTTTK